MRTEDCARGGRAGWWSRRARAAWVAAAATSVLFAGGCDGAHHPRAALSGGPTGSLVAPTAVAPAPSTTAPSVASRGSGDPATPSAPSARQTNRRAASRSQPPRPTTASAPTPATAAAKPTPAAQLSGPAATVTAAPATSTSGYQLFTNSDGSVVRWNPCRPVHYTVNLDDAPDPAGDLRDLQAALARVAEASGLSFVYDGTTTTVPTKQWLDADNSPSGIVVAWASPGSGPGESNLFGADADGEGGWSEAGTSTDGTHWVWRIVRGFVVLDPAKTQAYAPGFGAGTTRGVLLMHELGHAVGLGHAADPADVMFPVITDSSRAIWGAGDLQGLRLVGKAAGCIG